MRIPKLIPRGRAAALLTIVTAVLAACEAGPTSALPAEMTGRWLRAEGDGPASSSVMVRDHLHLDADGTYTWLREMYGPGGRAEDNLLHSEDVLGDWRVRGERLALRSVSGFTWHHATGERQLELSGTWDTRYTFELRGDRLFLHDPSVETATPYLLVFHRVRE